MECDTGGATLPWEVEVPRQGRRESLLRCSRALVFNSVGRFLTLGEHPIRLQEGNTSCRLTPCVCRNGTPAASVVAPVAARLATPVAAVVDAPVDACPVGIPLDAPLVAPPAITVDAPPAGPSVD